MQLVLTCSEKNKPSVWVQLKINFIASNTAYVALLPGAPVIVWIYTGTRWLSYTRIHNLECSNTQKKVKLDRNKRKVDEGERIIQ